MAEPGLPAAALGAFILLFGSAIARDYLGNRATEKTQPQFLADVEVETDEEDALDVVEQAKQFAQTVLSSASHPGLVFGLEGPWGVGKTSFLNLAERHWAADSGVVVFKFQPLRYASDHDLSDRFIRDLCAAIRQ